MIGRLAVLMVCLASVLTGCGPKKPVVEKHRVTGTVTFKGSPLPDGSIVFRHDGGEMSAGKLGTDGKYDVQVATGPNKVMIQSMEPQKENPDPNGMPRMLPGKSRIPAKYNEFSASGLSYEVKPGENSYDISLKE